MNGRVRPRPNAAQPPATAEELSGALHEVSNALTVVLGWLALARQRSTDPAVDEALAVALTHAELGRRLARAAFGAEATPEREREVEQVLADASRAAELEAAERDVRVTTSAVDVDGLLVPNPSAVLEVLINLLFNAIAFSPPAGHVVLEARALGESSVRFRVSDDGPGVAPERRDSLLFAPESTRNGGAGVGLPRSRTVAERHGGRLSLVDTQVGGCFDLSWPVTALQSGARIARLEPASLEGVHVGVLDDDSSVRGLLELGLCARGARVTAIARASELPAVDGCDVLLADLSPIADDPRSALAQLLRRAPNLAVVVISGDASGVPESIADLVNAAVYKPFDIGEVAECVLRALRRR